MFGVVGKRRMQRIDPDDAGAAAAPLLHDSGEEASV